MEVGTYIALAPGLVFLASLSIAPAILLIWFVACENIRPYLIPRAEIEAMARDAIARFGEGATDQLEILAHRAAFRCETAEELTHRRVARTVRRMRASEAPTPYAAGA